MIPNGPVLSGLFTLAATLSAIPVRASAQQPYFSKPPRELTYSGVPADHTLSGKLRATASGFLQTCSYQAANRLIHAACLFNIDEESSEAQFVTRFVADDHVAWDADETLLVFVTRPQRAPFVETLVYWNIYGDNFAGPHVVQFQNYEGNSLTKAISIAPDFVAVGSNFSSDGMDAPNTGEVDVFRRSGINLQWLQELRPQGGREADYFGEAVEVAGETLMVGAPGTDIAAHSATYQSNEGRVYIYDLSNGSFTPSQIVENPSISGRTFGAQIRLNGNDALIADRDSYHLNRYTRSGNGQWQRRRDVHPQLDLGYAATTVGMALTERFAFIPNAQFDTQDGGSLNTTLMLDADREMQQIARLVTPESICPLYPEYSPGASSNRIEYLRGRLLANTACRRPGGTHTAHLLMYIGPIYVDSFE